MSYAVGDTVVCPHHGAAIVEKTEERELSGETTEYLVLRMTHGDLTLMVPAESCEDVGIRDIVTTRQVDEVLEVLRTPEGDAPANWSRRFKANMEKLRSGDIFQVAEVVRNLATRQADGGVSAGERRMLARAKQILLSELAIAMRKDEEKADAAITKVLVDAHGLELDDA